jgi:dihydropteroate synthase
MPVRPDYDDVVAAVRDEVQRLAELAESKGVPREGILIGGTGYGKETPGHLILLDHAGEFVDTGWPVLMALSTKSLVGERLAVEMVASINGTRAPSRPGDWIA